MACKLDGLCDIAHRTASLAVGIAPFLQGGIVQFPVDLQGLAQEGPLMLRGVQAKFVGASAFHLSPFLGFDVPLERLQGDAARHCDKVAVDPQAGQPSFQSGDLLAQSMAAGALNVLDQAVNAELWIATNEQMDIIEHHLNLDQFLAPAPDDLHDDSFEVNIYRRQSTLRRYFGQKSI
jgi:hypothetical protein